MAPGGAGGETATTSTSFNLGANAAGGKGTTFWPGKHSGATATLATGQRFGSSQCSGTGSGQGDSTGSGREGVCERPHHHPVETR